jgi:hypothetical protein
MGAARDKLNVLYLLFCLGVGSLIGSLFDSPMVAGLATLGLIVVSVKDRFLR